MAITAITLAELSAGPHEVRRDEQHRAEKFFAIAPGSQNRWYPPRAGLVGISKTVTLACSLSRSPCTP